jgi:hypothetical protein
MTRSVREGLELLVPLRSKARSGERTLAHSAGLSLGPGDTSTRRVPRYLSGYEPSTRGLMSGGLVGRPETTSPRRSHAAIVL